MLNKWSPITLDSVTLAAYIAMLAMFIFAIRIRPHRGLKIIAIGAAVSIIAMILKFITTQFHFGCFSISGIFIEIFDHSTEILNTMYTVSYVLIIVGSVIFLLAPNNKNTTTK